MQQVNINMVGSVVLLLTEVENHLDFEEDRHRTLMGRRQVKSELGLLLLLLTCEI